MDSALCPGSPSSRQGSERWKRTSESSPIHPESAERSGRRMLLTKRAPGSRITRCRPSDYGRKRAPEVSPTRLGIALPTIRVQVPDPALLYAKLGSGGVHEISLKIFAESELQQLYTCTIPLVNLTNEHPLAKPLGLQHTLN